MFKLLNNVLNVQECDATNDSTSTVAGFITSPFKFKVCNIRIGLYKSKSPLQGDRGF